MNLSFGESYTTFGGSTDVSIHAYCEDQIVVFLFRAGALEEFGLELTLFDLKEHEFPREYEKFGQENREQLEAFCQCAFQSTIEDRSSLPPWIILDKADADAYLSD